MFSKFPFFQQYDKKDCGPTCLKMVAQYYGKSYSLNIMREICHISKSGISLEGLKVGAERIGFKVSAVKLKLNQDQDSLSNAPLPLIAFWNKSHFIVVYKITSKHIYIADPAIGKIRIDHEYFKKNWIVDNNDEGVALLLIPSENFDNIELKDIEGQSKSITFVLEYLKIYKRYFILLLLSLMMGSLILLLFPFLTKSIVDVGINQKKISFVLLILFAQLTLYISQTSISFFQRWLVLQISSRINIILSSDFLAKLTKLPISFFDGKQFGDLFQRINDHRKIESFFTASTLTIIFSFFNIILFGIVLGFYNSTIFFIFLTGTVLYFLWIMVFIRKRKLIDYQLFEEYATNTDMLIELIQGMEEIKLQNSETKRSNKWSSSQERLFKINLRATELNQYQDGGAFFINQIKDILITVIAAMAVIQGSLSLGALIAIQFIIGQLNAPIQQIVTFIRTGNEAKLSLDRIVEIHDKKEEDEGKEFKEIGQNGLHNDINIKDLYFRYNDLSNYVLKDINLTIPKGKVTAIVGASGSGKTTLIKILLGIYKPISGSVNIGENPLNTIQSDLWRENCGAVMQDGYIFNDTIANNIAESDTETNHEKLIHATRIANIEEFVNSQALKYDTIIGNHGNGISQGQRQRILIARAVYKNSNYLFFDEATNALDAKNEYTIVHNLQEFYKDKSVIIVAHRLSTVRNADNIIVLENGSIVESGSHSELIANKSYYYELIRNQLELGN